LLVCLAASTAQGQGLRWRSDLESAKREAAQTRKLVLLHFGATWCNPCKNLEETVLSQPQVAQAIEQQFVPVKLDVDRARPIAQQYQVGPIPADVVITPSGQVVGRGTGYLPAAKYLERLNGIAAAGRKPPTAANPPSNSLAADSRLYDPFQRATPAPRVGQQFPPASAPDAAHRPEGATVNPGSVANPGSAASPSRDPYGNIPPAMPDDRYGSPPGASNSSQPPPSAPVPGPSAPAAAPRQPGLPPLGFEGYCVVTMHQQVQWAKGDTRWGAIHEGRLYLFATPVAQQQFLRDPQRYAPVMSGIDVVLLMETGQQIDGQRRFGATYQAPGENGPRIYLFANEATLQKFESNPVPYIEKIRQAQNRPLGQFSWQR
jgi:protein disulfide-isomerase